MTSARLALIGVPANSSGTVDGVARAPAVLRRRGLGTALARQPGFTDADDLMLPVPVPVRGPSGLLAEDALVAMIGRVAQAVGGARGRGWFPLLLGGDCPVILGAQLAAVDYPQPGGLTWRQITDLTATALATDGRAGWSVCIYNPDLDPGRDGADAIISYITQAITVSNQPAR